MRDQPGYEQVIVQWQQLAQNNYQLLDQAVEYGYIGGDDRDQLVAELHRGDEQLLYAAAALYG